MIWLLHFYQKLLHLPKYKVTQKELTQLKYSKMASSSSNHDSRKTTYIPAAALKRFANDLEREGSSNKFLDINRERVNDFIEKGPTDIGTGKSSGAKSGFSTRNVAGINNYEAKSVDKSFLHLQNNAEFQNGLGSRSRFGEGDGSFFDQWLNSDVVKSKHVVDKDGLPLMK